MRGGGGGERAAGNGSGFATTRGLNLPSPACEMGGESHRLAELARAGCGGAGDESQRDLSPRRHAAPFPEDGRGPGPSAQVTVFSPIADLSRVF